MFNHVVHFIHSCGLVLKRYITCNRHTLIGGRMHEAVIYTPRSVPAGEILEIRVVGDSSLSALHLACLKFNECIKKEVNE